jgi:predicted acylesterase/phospholipase RssA
MLLELATSPRRGRTKLGLALAGGGFRASLFHVGVLRDLARRGLLGKVEVLSTVSGGSIVGALYYLLLRERLNQREPMTAADGWEIVERTRTMLIAGVQKDLRNRLLANPVALLASLTTARGLADSMARLYDRHFYRPAAGRAGFRLRELLVYPGGQKVSDLEAHNRAARWKIPALIVNATSLNSGSPFRFSATEIGEPLLGYFRRDEIETELAPRKLLLEEISFDELKAVTEGRRDKPAAASRLTALETGIALWWRARGEAVMTAGAYEELLPEHAQGRRNLYDALDRAPLGLVRAAKLAAWYVLVGGPTGVSGAYDPAEYRRFFWRALREIDDGLSSALDASLGAGGDPGREARENDLMRLVLNVYYLRSARKLSSTANHDFDVLTLARAVSASACFPPVFPPLALRGIYDDAEVALLGLTDGGVYDNVGVTALLQEGCTHVIASDTGSAFDTVPSASTGRLGMVSRITNILMNVVGNEQRVRLRGERRMNRTLGDIAASGAAGTAGPLSDFPLRGLAYCQITGGGPEGDAAAIARLRTDLDAFGDLEADALIAHGGRVASEQITAYIAESDFPDREVPREPAPLPAPPEAPWRVRRVLSAGRHRFFRSLRLRSVPAWALASLAAAAVLADAGAGLRWTRMAIGNLWRASALWAPAIFGTVAKIWREAGPLPRMGIFLLPIAAAVLWQMLAPRAGRRLSRSAGRVVKWLRLLGGNVLWILGPVPLVLAALGAALGSALYLFDGRLALRQTRRSPTDRGEAPRGAGR